MKPIIAKSILKYVNRIAETVQYKNWSDSFCREEINSSTLDFLSEIRNHIDFNNLTAEEAYEIGFRKWDDNLYLVPIYLLPIVPIGTELTSISGDVVKYNGLNIDNDNRSGSLAWGIKIKSCPF